MVSLSSLSPPPLCGCVPVDDKYRCKPSDQVYIVCDRFIGWLDHVSSCDPCQVAARVKTEDGEEQWILAEVHSYNSHNHRYIVDDIDEEGHNEQR